MYRSSDNGSVTCSLSRGSAVRGAGFSLIETLVALSLVGVALLLTMSLIFQEPRALRRIAAHEEALRALEVTLEAVRAGSAVPPGREQVALEALYQPEEPAATDLRVWTERDGTLPGGLFHLTLTARYRVGPQRFQRTVETMVWTPHESTAVASTAGGRLQFAGAAVLLRDHGHGDVPR